MAPARISTDTSHSNYPHTKANTSHSAAALSEALEDATSRFTERNTISLKLHNDAIKSLPGGNTRSLLHTTPFPVFMKSGKSYQVTSEDNHTSVSSTPAPLYTLADTKTLATPTLSAS